MATQLTTCTKSSRQLFESCGDVTGGEIHQRQSLQYGDSTFLQKTMYEWNEMLQNGQTSITNAEHSKVVLPYQ
jgi:hypothetical protein